MSDKYFYGDIQNVADEIHISSFPCTECGSQLLEKHFLRLPYCNKCIEAEWNARYEERMPKIRWLVTAIFVVLLLLQFIIVFIIPVHNSGGLSNFLVTSKPTMLFNVPMNIWLTIIFTGLWMLTMLYQERRVTQKIVQELPKHQP